MNTEQLIKANEIQAQIERLDRAKKCVKRANEKNGTKALRFYSSGDTEDLLTEVLPIPLDNFIEMYILSTDKKIVELEKEFGKL